MIKGGYKIVNFNGAALSSTAVELSGIYDQIVDDYDKPVMVSGVSLNGDIMDDAYAGVQEKTAGDLSKSVELTVYGGIITVTDDDEVTFVLSKTTAELTAEIGDLEDLDTTDKDSIVDAINELNTAMSELPLFKEYSGETSTVTVAPGNTALVSVPLDLPEDETVLSLITLTLLGTNSDYLTISRYDYDKNSGTMYFRLNSLATSSEITAKVSFKYISVKKSYITQ